LALSPLGFLSGVSEPKVFAGTSDTALRHIGTDRLSMSALAILHSFEKGLTSQLTAITCLTNRLQLKEVVEPTVSLYCPTRHADVVFQVISSLAAQSVDLSVWQDVQGLGILYLSVIAGEVNLNVCELTNVPGTP
jgi:hypothetical protein